MFCEDGGGRTTVVEVVGRSRKKWPLLLCREMAI